MSNSIISLLRSKQDKMKNTLKVNLTINEHGLKKFKNVPTFKNLLHPNQLKELKEGSNIITVNHTVWGSLQRVISYDSKNMKVFKVIN